MDFKLDLLLVFTNNAILSYDIQKSKVVNIFLINSNMSSAITSVCDLEDGANYICVNEANEVCVANINCKKVLGFENFKGRKMQRSICYLRDGK